MQFYQSSKQVQTLLPVLVCFLSEYRAIRNPPLERKLFLGACIGQLSHSTTAGEHHLLCTSQNRKTFLQKTNASFLQKYNED